MSHLDDHLSNERIQGFLDQRLGTEAEGAVRSHLAECARCRKEVEAWRSLFASLSEMPELSPSPLFAQRVMDEVEVPVRQGLLERLRSFLPAWLAGARSDDRGRANSGSHLEPRVLLGYVDQALSPRRKRAVSVHVERCAACRDELGRWRSVVDRIESMGRVSPAPGFADAVMARVRMPATAPNEAPAGILQRLGDQLRDLLPRTRRAWVVASASALAPVAASTIGAFALFNAHPLLTPANLASFLWWRVTGTVQGVVGLLAERILASPVALEIWRAAQGISGEPLMAGAGAVAFGLTTVAALWILYRNLTALPPADRGYANVSA